jgi:hypothetical protein
MFGLLASEKDVAVPCLSRVHSSSPHAITSDINEPVAFYDLLGCQCGLVTARAISMLWDQP